MARAVRSGRLTDRVPERGEDFHTLATMAGARVEHIVSSDCPDTAEQVQVWDEWVLVISGAAELVVLGGDGHAPGAAPPVPGVAPPVPGVAPPVPGVADDDSAFRRIALTAGDWVLIPASTPHRVASTLPGTHWIAVHAPVP